MSSGRLALPEGSSLHEQLVGAFRDVLEHAHHARALCADDPATAVHEYRKSLRRARALVRLLGDRLPGAQRAQLDQALGAAARQASSARDAEVLPATLAGLELERPQREAAAAFLPGAPAAAPATLQAVDQLPAALAEALPSDVRRRDLRRGIAEAHRRARKAMRKVDGPGERAHRWRKRTKELTYQVELLASSGAEEPRKARKSLARLSEKLGEINDLMVLRGHLVGAPDNGVTPAPVAEVVRTIDAEVARRLDAALRRGRDLLERSPKKFAKTLVKAARRARKH